MTTLDLDKLEAIAAAATPGPWREGADPWNGKPLFVSDALDGNGNPTSIIRAPSPEWGEEGGFEITIADSAYIAAANPETVLKLIRRVRELEAAVNEIRAIASDSEGVAGWHLNGEIARWDELNLAALTGEFGRQRHGALRGRGAAEREGAP